MMKRKLLSSLIMGLMTINVTVAADNAAGRPRLVVGIVVDQLRTDYLEYLRDLFGDKGFRRLMSKGVYVKDLDFKADLTDPASATALIYTGALPRVSGIPADKIYDPVRSKTKDVLDDPGSMGNFTQEALSPVALRVSTIADEMAGDSSGLSSIYAISADPRQAILMAGHAGNCALWINESDGQWSSTAYYRDFPQFISRRNRVTPLRQRLDTMRWTPALRPDKYPGIPMLQREAGFRHTFSSSDRDLYRRFRTSAPGNAEVTEVALSVIDELSLGKRTDVTDMISVGYSAAPYVTPKEDAGELELQDTYVRLDAQIGRLLDEIDRKVGLDNAVVFLSSTGYYNDNSVPDEKLRIPTGEVTLRRVESLLNSYLSAKYGNGDYVKGIFRNQIHLDRSALETRTPDVEAAIRDARDFIVKMSGISDARTLGEVLADSSTDGARLRNSLDPKSAGDIILTFNPGWNVTDDTSYPAVSHHQRSAAVSAPFFLMAPSASPRTITTPVEASAIAPTISSAIHIRAPNGATSRPIAFQ